MQLETAGRNVCDFAYHIWVLCPSSSNAPEADDEAVGGEADLGQPNLNTYCLYIEIMNILLLGSGGREHALAWKIAQSEKLGRLFVAPGNPGMAEIATCVALDPMKFPEVGSFVVENKIDMVVVGPEAPLVEGIVDYFRSRPELEHVALIGPSAAGARLEGSKDFAKTFMRRHHIPTADYPTFGAEQYEEACRFLETLKPPYVLKADGLAAGKGVLILDDLETAKSELKAMLSGRFGAASAQVVIEEFLSGIECSVFALTDGKHYQILPEAKDYKRIGEGDGLEHGRYGGGLSRTLCHESVDATRRR